MPSSRRETSLADAVLIAALAGRSLAAAARRAGYRPLVADLFRDLDTRRDAERAIAVPGDPASGFRDEALLAALDELSAGQGNPVDLVYGSGFEARPDLLAELVRRHRLLGTGPAALEQIKNPATFFGLLDRLGIGHPETTLTAPAGARGWLVKRRGATGGGHVRPAGKTNYRPDCYFQKRAPGRPVSALFLADGLRALTLGFSEQWCSPRGPSTAFCFGGAVQPAPIDAGQAAGLDRAVRKVAGAVELLGLCSADFLLRDDGFDLLEVNPRPGATLDIFDRDPGAPLFELHRQACLGRLPQSWRGPARASGCAIVYAESPILLPTAHRWPRWAADRPAPGTRIGKDEPLCTVTASGRNPAEARRRALWRAGEILALSGASAPPVTERQIADKHAEAPV